MAINRVDRFFLGLFILHVVLLVLFLDNTYTDGWNLRQAQTAMMTRNIAADGLYFLPTRLDFFAPYAGDVILEFPFLHSITAIANNWFGESEIIGRVIILAFHLLNIVIVYLILAQLFSSITAKTFTLIYCYTPIIFYSAHAYIPETTMLFFYLLSFYCFLQADISRFFGRYVFRVALALLPLLKPIGGVIFFPILAASFKRGLRPFSREALLLGICSIPILLWMSYGYIINNGSTGTGGSWANWSDILLGRGGIVGNWINPEFYSNVLFSLIFLNSTPVVMGLAGLSLFKRTPFVERQFLAYWAIANIVVLFLFAGANRGHPYYQIYFVPIILIYAASYFDMLVKKLERVQLQKGVLVLVLSHVFVSLVVFAHGVDETKRIDNLDEFRFVSEAYISGMPRNKENFVVIQSERMTSGVYDYSLNHYTQQFSLRHHRAPKLHLREQVEKGAKYLFMINTSYGNTVSISKNNHAYWEWLNLNTAVLYDSPSMMLFEFR